MKRLDSVYKDEFPDSLFNLKNGLDKQLVKMSDILFVERMKNIVAEWRAGLLGERNRGPELQGSRSDANQKFQTTFFKMRPALVLNGLTSHQLKLIKLVYNFTPRYLLLIDCYLIKHFSKITRHWLD